MSGKGAPKKEFVQCAHCGRQNDKLEGFAVSINIGKSLMCRISCPCGIMTKLCETRGDLQSVWNSRPKKPFVQPVVSVKHAGPRGVEPGTVNAENAKNTKKQGPF